MVGADDIFQFLDEHLLFHGNSFLWLFCFKKREQGAIQWLPDSRVQIQISKFEARNKLDAFGKSPQSRFSGIPAKAGIQELPAVLDPGDPVPAKAGSRGDGFGEFLRMHQESRAANFNPHKAE
jgi:hypothetical protein